MNEPSDTPDIEAQRAELARRLERVRRKKLRNDALEKSLISRADAKQILQARFSILEEQCEVLHQKCIAHAAGCVSPEVAETLSREIQKIVAEALNETKEDFLRVLKQ